MSEFAIRTAVPAEDAGPMAKLIVAGRLGEPTYGLREGTEEYAELITAFSGKAGEELMRRYMQPDDDWPGVRSETGIPPRARVAVPVGRLAIVGLATSREVFIRGLPGVNLDFLFVRPDMKGRGIGTRLMDDFVKYAESRPCRLQVGVKNPAQRLYRRYGFEAVGQTAGGALANSIEMVRPARLA